MFNGYKVIIYNDTEMETFQGILKSIETEDMQFVQGETLDGTRYSVPIQPRNMEIIAMVTDRVIELDPTTMKRIAMYNKSEDLKGLNDEIKKAKKRLKELKDDVKNQSEKLDNLKEFISHFIDCDCVSVDKYYEMINRDWEED